jgi:ABC-type transport system substrate-binding protein
MKQTTRPSRFAEIARHGRVSRRALLHGTAALGLSAPAVATWLTAPADEAAAQEEIPGPPLAENPQEGGTIRVGLSQEPNSFDSILAYNSEAWRMAFQLYSGLMTYDYDPQVPVPDLAEDWPEVSDDGLEYRFTLRSGLKFSNDAPVTAQDVKYSLERCLSPEWQSWGAAYLFSVAGAEEYNTGAATTVEGITAPDDQTVIFRLNRPDVTFLAALALQQNFIVPAAEVERLGEDFARQPVGTGAFMLREYDAANQRAVAVPNPNFLWQPLPYVDELEFDWSLTDDVITLRLERGEFDSSIRGIPASQFDRIVNDPQFAERIMDFAAPGTDWLGFDLTRAPFDDVNVRRAIGMAIDVERIAQLKRGTAAPLHGVFPVTSSAYDESFTGFPYDPDAARNLLAEAGQSDLSFALTSSDDEDELATAQAIQQDLAAIGITVEIDPRPASAALERMQQGETSAWITGWLQVLLDPHDIVGNIHYAGGGSNYGHVDIPEVNELIDAALVEQDQEARREMYRQIEELLIVEHAVQVPLFRPITKYLISDRLRNYYHQPSTGQRWERMWLEE